MTGDATRLQYGHQPHGRAPWYIRLAAEIVASGMRENDVAFLKSRWCDELRGCVQTWCEEFGSNEKELV